MNKKMLILIILICAMLFSSCTMIPVSRLEAMFGTDRETNITTRPGSGSDEGNDSASVSAGTTAAAGNESAGTGADTVTISREEYEKYQQYSDLFDIYDFAKENFYQEPDTDKMTETAIRGLMAGLDDPYSFYYNPKEYQETKRALKTLTKALVALSLCMIILAIGSTPDTMKLH